MAGKRHELLLFAYKTSIRVGAGTRKQICRNSAHELPPKVSLAMLMTRSRTKFSARTVANRLHERGYRFRDLRQKPILTPDDVKERYRFAKKYKDHLASWWLSAVQVHVDNHMFKVATTSKGRKLLAKRSVRGVYRKKGKSLRPGHVKPNAKMKLGTGSKGILKAGGVGGGKVLVWHTITGRWGGDAAADLYKNVIAKALAKRYKKKKKKSFVMLEDNDPTGNTSKKGISSWFNYTIYLKLVPSITKKGLGRNNIQIAVGEIDNCVGADSPLADRRCHGRR